MERDRPIEGAQGGRSRSWGVWVERVVTFGIFAFVLYRLGPQLGALAGVGPDLGRSPAYTVVTLDGDTVTSEELEGRVVVVNFWATWCAPCRIEMPSLESLHQDRAADGVVVLGLATDAGSVDTVRDFVDERGFTFLIGRATGQHRSAFGGIAGIPTTFLIDRNGVIRHRVVGYFTPPALRVAVGRLLAEDGTEMGTGEGVVEPHS